MADFAFLTDDLAAANPNLATDRSWRFDPTLDIWQAATGEVVMGPIARGVIDGSKLPPIIGELNMKIDLAMLGGLTPPEAPRPEVPGSCVDADAYNGGE